MLLLFVAAISIGALVIADAGALAWAAGRIQAFRDWMERQ